MVGLPEKKLPRLYSMTALLPNKIHDSDLSLSLEDGMTQSSDPRLQ